VGTILNKLGELRESTVALLADWENAQCEKGFLRAAKGCYLEGYQLHSLVGSIFMTLRWIEQSR